MESENSSFKQDNETSASGYIWTEIKMLQLLVIQCRLGQIVLRALEKFLWIVEKCAEWSLSSEENCRGDDGKVVEKELVRPLPWILFLPSLIILRIIRVSLNIVIFLLGFSQITANDMVRLMQKMRTYLITLRNSWTKGKCYKKDKRSTMNEAKQVLIRSIRLTLSSLSCLDASKPSLSPPPTKIHVNSALDLDAATMTSEEKSVTESMDSTKQRGLINSTESEQDEEKRKTLQEQLNQLTSDSSDSEYICSADRDNSSIDSDSDTSVSSNELNDIMQDVKNWREVEKRTQQIQKFLDAERAAASAGKQAAANAKQATVNVEQAAVDSEQTTVDIEQVAANAEQTIANAEQVTVNVEQAAVDSEQTTVDDEQAVVNIEQTIANAEQVTVNVEQAAVDSEQTTVDDEQAVVNIEQTTVNVEQAAVDAEEATSEQKSSAKESRDKVEERHSSSRRIDSPEYHTSDRSSQEGDLTFYSPISSDSDTPKSSAPIAEKPVFEDSLKTAEFINGEIHSASTISELKSSEKANNGAVVEKRGANAASKCHKGKRTSHSNRRKK